MLNGKELSDAELERYSRQLLLPEIDIAGQEAIRASHVLIIGAGGLGNPAALYLAAAGVGQLTLMDNDRVEASNLARQIGFRDAQQGEFKVDALATTLTALNPGCRVEALRERAGDDFAQKLSGVTLVLDCCDNFATRYAVNAACVKARVPLISGAAIRLTGQVASFDLRTAGHGCYRCLFPDTGEAELRCSEAGVLGPLVGVAGSFQALLALRFLASGVLPNRFWQFDGTIFHWRDMHFRRDPSCPVCGSR